MMSAISMDMGADVPPAPASEGYRKTAWGRVIVLAIVLFAGSALRLILTPLQEPMKLDMQFTDMQVGVIKGVAMGLPIAVSSIPIGLAIDHMNRARLMLFLAICWTVGTAWTAFAHSFLTLCLAHGLSGFGSGSALAVALSMIADLCMPEKRGRVTLLAGVGIWVGIAFAFAFGGALYGHFALPGASIVPGLAPWRQATLVFAIIGAVLLIPMFFFREPERHEQEQKSNEIAPALRAMWKRRGFLIPLVLGQMAGGMGEGAAGVWAAPVLTRNFGLQPNQFGAWMGGLLLVSGIFGSILGGVVADWGNNSRLRGGILIGAIVSTLISAPAAAYTVMPSVGWFAFALGAMLLGCTIAQMVGITAVTVLIPNEERGMTLGIIGVFGNVIGLLTAPLAIWTTIAIYGSEQHTPAGVAFLGVATGVLALIGYVIAMINAPAKRVEA